MKDTKERIIKQALTYFVQHNYEGASLNDIAGVLKLTKGGIYHYFSSKEELFKETVIFFLDQMEKMFLISLQPEADLKKNIQLFFMLEQMHVKINKIIGLDIFEDYADIIYLLYTGIKKIPAIKEKIQQIYTGLLEHLTMLFLRARKKGLIRRDLDVRALAFQVAAFSEGAMLINAAFSKHDFNRQAKQCLKNFLKFLDL
jgi:AcrR family transcriptional regulator